MTTPLVILILLCSPLLLSYFAGKRGAEACDRFASYGLGLAFLFFALGHFVATEGMVEMLPPWLPLRDDIIYLTGMFEVVIAIGIFLSAYRQVAGQVAIATLICFFSANIYAAWHSVGLGGHQWGPGYLLIRAPLQLILIGWAYYFCVKRPSYQSMTDSI
ncbi:DoxX family protein [Photobacterium sp. R1]